MKNVKLPTNRNFGIVFFIVFLLIAIYPLAHKENIVIWSFLISLIFLILGILNSKILNPLIVLWLQN